MTLTQLQQEAREEFDKKAKKAGIGGLVRITIHPIINSLTARVYAAALDAAIQGIERLEIYKIGDDVDAEDEHDEDVRTELMTSVLSHLRTLREGITGNEKSL